MKKLATTKKLSQSGSKNNKVSINSVDLKLVNEFCQLTAQIKQLESRKDKVRDMLVASIPAELWSNFQLALELPGTQADLLVSVPTQGLIFKPTQNANSKLLDILGMNKFAELATIKVEDAIPFLTEPQVKSLITTKIGNRRLSVRQHKPLESEVDEQTYTIDGTFTIRSNG